MIEPTKIRTDAGNWDPMVLVGFPVKLSHWEDPHPRPPPSLTITSRRLQEADVIGDVFETPN